MSLDMAILVLAFLKKTTKMQSNLNLITNLHNSKKMSLPFRDFGIGSDINIAFEYCNIKSLNKNSNNAILQKTNILELRVPENFTSSKLELYIWVAHTVPDLLNVRELSITEKKYYEFIKNFYGVQYSNILSKYSNSDTTIALRLNPNEEKIWKSKIRCNTNRNNVWRFIGTV